MTAGTPVPPGGRLGHNAATATLAVEAERYDVAVAAVAAAAPPVVTGGLEPVSVRVANNGNRAATADVTLSVSAGVDTTPTVVGTVRGVSLAAGGSQAVTLDWDTTGLAPGSYTLVAEAKLVAAGDPAVAPADARPDDNTLAAAVAVEPVRHELAVAGVQVQPSANVGDAVPARVTVENRGNQSGTFTVTLRDSRGVVAGTSGSLTLAAGTPPTSVVVPFTWNTAGLAAGSYTLTATVTPTAGVEASGTSAPVTLNAPSNKLAVSSISPNQFRPGQTYAVTITGTGFVAGTKLKFANGSGPAPAFSNVRVVSGTTITATVTVGGDAKTSSWDLLLTNPDATTATLARAVTVTR